MRLIVRTHGEEGVLALLDGEFQIDKVLNVATTNYPKLLDKRLVARPRRFDRVIKIDVPSPRNREVYLRTKLGVAEKELAFWVEKTDGLTFAALAELVISVMCLGNAFDETLNTLRKLVPGRDIDTELSSQTIGIRPVAKTACKESYFK